MSSSKNAYLEGLIKARPQGWEFASVSSAPFHFPFEEYDHFFWHGVFSNWKLPIYVGVIYILTIFGLRRWMRDRPAFSLKGPLFWWNLCLGIFSIMGLVRSYPGFMSVLRNEGGFYQSICVKTGADIPFGFWLVMFVLSKLVELGDTVFIVLRKRPLIFLQWYHHLATMSVAWILTPLAEPVGRWYCTLNYGVHSFMYPYFALKAKNVHIPTWIANLITTMQFSQMIIGFGVNMLSMYYYYAGYDCARYPLSIRLFGLVYGSFLILFGKLFYDSVIKKGRIQRDAKMDKKSK